MSEKLEHMAFLSMLVAVTLLFGLLLGLTRLLHSPPPLARWIMERLFFW